jgi:type III restriction enzyme
MDNPFFDQPIINSPYDYPSRHWELDAEGQPTQRIIETRRGAEFITPIPKPRQRGRARASQREFVMDEGAGMSTEDQQYDVTAAVNEIRRLVDQWRKIPSPSDWGVTPETARLLLHWRQHKFSHYRPFFCQVEAAETLIWLTEVAPRLGANERRILQRLENANNEANPGLLRAALKLATGAGKTTVMAMIIAWQTINAVRHPNSRRFTRGFLVVTPGLTIKDRLRVLQPNDPDSYYASRELVPSDMLGDLQRAKIVITNYHALRPRERVEISRGGRDLLQGHGEPVATLESEGQMMQRVMPELMGLRNIMALNDEGHHCYRRKPGDDDEGRLTREDRQEADRNNEEARVWISGLEMVKRKLGVPHVVDLSATPFFLRGSGYMEGTLFPWTVSDFSLMDAIECGIVKLPRVPVADNIPGEQVPVFRNLWEHISEAMPKAGRGKNAYLDPLGLPVELQTALEALYGHYRITFEQWQASGATIPPCFIVVCNNTSTSKLVYDYISGFERENEDGSTTLQNGRLELFRNFDEYGNRYSIPRTLLIDSQQLESGDKLSDDFRRAASAQIDWFRWERVERTGNREDADNITEQELLREVMNTVGKEERLGGQIRCVVSVSMLTEGWDANTVTHVLGVRAFGTQLLCEQVVGRALRRQSYDLNEENRFNVEYADVLGIPFDFTARPVVVGPGKPRQTVHVRAMRPERDHLEITFPRVSGYREDPPKEDLVANFTDDSRLDLTPDLVGPTQTRNEGIIGEGVDLNLVHTGDLRISSLVLHLTKRLLETKWRDPNQDIKMHLFGKLRNVVKQWLDTCLVCRGGTYPAQLMYQSLADMACNRITAAITNSQGERSIKALLDSYNPTGSTRHVNFTTSKTGLWATDSRKCHLNLAVLDSDWEAEFCRAVESHPNVMAYVKNHNLGLEVPYLYGSTPRTYIPDFIVQVDDGQDDPLNLIVEIKGYRGEDAREKKNTMEAYWLPGVNALGQYGRWAFAEFTAVFDIEDNLHQLIDSCRNRDNEESDGDKRSGRYEYAEVERQQTVAASWLADAGGSEPQIEDIPRRRSEL